MILFRFILISLRFIRSIENQNIISCQKENTMITHFTSFHSLLNQRTNHKYLNNQLIYYYKVNYRFLTATVKNDRMKVKNNQYTV